MAKIITKKEAEKISSPRWFHPDDVMTKLTKLVEQNGTHKFWKGSGMNVSNDLFRGILLAYGLRKKFEREYLIAEGDNPPDIMVGSFNGASIKDRPFKCFNVEIVDIPDIVDQKEDKVGWAIEMLRKKKLTGYKMPVGTWLLVFINSMSSNSILVGLNKFYKENKELFSEFEGLLAIRPFEGAEEDLNFHLVSINEGWYVSVKLVDEFLKPHIPTPLLDKFLVKIKPE